MDTGCKWRVAAMAALLTFTGQAIAQPAAPETPPLGVPVTGAAGITESVATIMERARIDDARAPRPPRLNFEFENEWREPKANPDAPAVASWPPQPEGSAPASLRAPQTVSTPNFTGATLADTGSFPPDTMGAVGPSQFIVAVNGRIRSFNKTTGAADGALNASQDSFFASVMTPPVASNFTSDPRIRYDRLTGRWFVIIIDVPGGAGDQANRVLVAVSSGDTITASSNFTFYFFQMSGTLFADYPTLGIDANALYIGGNMFTLAGGFSGTLGTVVRKSSVLSGGSIVTTTFSLLPDAASAGPFTPQGVDNYDPAATEGYFIGVDNATFSTLMLRRVSTPGGTPTISGDLSITVPTTTFPNRVPHLGNTGGTNGQLDSLDDRLYAAHLRNGRLWTAHNFRVSAAGVASTATGNRNAVRWYELGNLTTTPIVIQSGTVFDNAAANPVHHFIPSIMVSGQGHAALGFTMSGNTLSPNAGTNGRLQGDTLGTIGAVVNYTNSTAAYNPPADPGGAGGRRWGDYSYTSLDPCDDMTMWTIQQFADATNSYGVRAVRLLAPAPTATACASVTNIEQGQSNVVIPLSGSGFFEPAANVGSCRILLGATASGTGVTITPTFNSATSLSLSVSATAGATLGARTITITNPDSQASAAATGCINIVAAAATTISSLNRVGTAAVCAGQSLDWTATFGGSVTGSATTNFQFNGGTGTAITGIAGSGSTRTISTNVGTAAGALRLDLVNSTGITPTVSNVPFQGESITVNANPSAFAVTGGGAFCAGSAGPAVSLSGSQTGVNYQLLRDGNPVGSPVPGTGAALNFGNQTVAGTYTVSASNATTACGTSMTGSAVVTVNPVPGAFQVTGGGAFCAGGAGQPVGLAGSQSGVNYQLLRDGNPVGSPLAGTGNALAFGNQTSGGSYTVAASNATTSCAATMTGSASVTVNPVPTLNNNTPAMICTATATSINLVSTPAGASFAYTASNTAGSVTGFGAGIANPIAQTLTGSGDVTYVVTPTLGSCPGSSGNVVQRVTDPQPATATLPGGVVTAAYSFQLTAPGALQSTTFALASGALPADLTLSPAGLISGTPSAAGTANFSISGSDATISGCSISRSYSIEVRVDDLFADGFE